MAYRTLKRYFAECAVVLCIFCLFTIFAFNVEGAQLVDRIVAVVNDDITTLFKLNQAIKPYEKRIDELEYSPEKKRKMMFKVREDVLNQLVDQQLTDQEVKRLKLTVSEKEIDSTIERIKETNFYSDEDLRKALIRDGMTVEKYQKHIKEQILRTKLVNVEIKSKIIITKEDVKSYFDSHRDNYRGKTKYHLRNIIMKIPNFASEAEKLAIFEKMEDVLTQLKRGMPFQKMAEAHSESLLASEGGDLGLFNFDELSPQLQETVKNMRVGEFTYVLDTEQGYQIFFVEDIVKMPGKAIEQVSDEIEETLFNEIVDKKFKAWLNELRDKSHIKLIK